MGASGRRPGGGPQESGHAAHQTAGHQARAFGAGGWRDVRPGEGAGDPAGYHGHHTAAAAA